MRLIKMDDASGAGVGWINPDRVLAVLPVVDEAKRVILGRTALVFGGGVPTMVVKGSPFDVVQRMLSDVQLLEG
jgi:hypothetical protein